jgi:hypothetical protein
MGEPGPATDHFGVCESAPFPQVIQAYGRVTNQAMADLQTQFIKFEQTIRVDRDGEKATLVEKRERILRRLSDGIKNQRAAGKIIPSYSCRNQGSYAMDTGIKPLDGDYDLDVAVIFDFEGQERPDPVSVKGWVYTAVENHTMLVRWREPCVTVYYTKEGEPMYHVDLAVYAGNDREALLARGRQNAQEGARMWEPADPAGLIEAIQTRFDDKDEQGQFRRCIRYLKRWKDLNLSTQGNEAPRGIALTACAYRWFVPSFDRHPEREGRVANDHAALRALVVEILGKFDWRGRLAIALPTPPGNDLFAIMSDRQLEVFKTKLESLRDKLTDAAADPDPHTAATTLAKCFGEDFPIPDKPSTARKLSSGYVSSGNSG